MANKDHAAEQRRYKERHPERVRATAAKVAAAPDRRAKNAANQRAYVSRFPERQWARRAVGQAVRNGVLVRLPCEECGEPMVHAHHHLGYAHPLEVRWLCVKHHVEEHYGSRDH